MTKLDVIPLTEAEMKLAQLVGEWRHQTIAQERRVGNGYTSKRDEVIGAMGEIAFAKYMDIYPNIKTEVEPGSADYVINGITIDVKSTHDPHRINNLVVPLHKIQRGKCNVYVLVSVKDTVCHLAGFTYGTIVFASPTRDLGWGESYFVERRYLQPASEILNAILQIPIQAVIRPDNTHSIRNIEQALNFYWGSNGKFIVKGKSELLTRAVEIMSDCYNFGCDNLERHHAIGRWLDEYKRTVDPTASSGDGSG